MKILGFASTAEKARESKKSAPRVEWQGWRIFDDFWVRFFVFCYGEMSGSDGSRMKNDFIVLLDLLDFLSYVQIFFGSGFV